MYHNVQQAIEHNQITTQELVKGILCVMAAWSMQILVEIARVCRIKHYRLRNSDAVAENRFADEETEMLCYRVYVAAIQQSTWFWQDMWIACALALQQSGRPLPTGEYKHARWNEGIRIALDENATIACRAGESWHAISSRLVSATLKHVGKGPRETSNILTTTTSMLRKHPFIYKTCSTWPARCLSSCFSFWHTCHARRLRCMGGKAGSQQNLWETNIEVL